MWDALLFCAAGFCLSSTAPKLEGVATIYWRGDGYNNGRLGCKGAALRSLGHSQLRDDLPIVATRGKRYPFRCGQWVWVENVRTGLRTLAQKLDTGTFSCWKGAKRITALVCPRGWSRYSVLDMTKEVARRIGHNGLERVRVFTAEQIGGNLAL